MLRRSNSALFKSLAIWGGGTMGGGIAQVTAAAGLPVTVVEVSDERIAVSKKAITASLARVAKKKFEGKEADGQAFVAGILAKITFTTDEAAAAARADCIVEAVLEDLAIKQALWKKLDALAPKECIFATNTSSLSVHEQAAVTGRADRFGGLHFFSPVPMMKLVEVVRADETSQATVDALVDFSKKIQKAPVVAKDTKGFIVNRLLNVLTMEAARLVERGVATVEDVDVGMRLGAGHPMGPFTLMDSVGLDVGAFVMKSWHDYEPENPLWKPSQLLMDKVKEGKLGRKTGEGFYKYTK